MLTVFISFTKKVNDTYFLYLHLFQINFKNSEKKKYSLGFFYINKESCSLGKAITYTSMKQFVELMHPIRNIYVSCM